MSLYSAQNLVESLSVLDINVVKAPVLQLPALLLVLKFLAFLHFEIVNHLGSFVCKFDRHWDGYDTGIRVVALAELESNAKDCLLFQTQLFHLVNHDLALLGNDVLTFASKGCEDLEVVILLGHADFIDDTSGQHGFG